MEEVNKELNETKTLNFLEEIIEADLASGKCESIMTRFPPEPNGYLHIGHAKSICINFGLAKKYGGKTNLRFDDTNPVKEDTEYVDSIKEDIKWLGFEWENERYASDYFDQLYEWAELLIQKGLRMWMTRHRRRSVQEEVQFRFLVPRAHTVTAAWRKTSNCSVKCVMENMRKGRRCSAQR